MCFSAEASFVGGAVISTIGIATLKQVKKPSQKAFASIPLLFGFQQIAEGFLWLGLLNANFAFIQNISAYLFLILAQIVWPTMVPYSCYALEENRRRKKYLKYLVILGVILSLYFTYCLLTFNIDPQIVGCHIKYNASYPQSIKLYAFAIYLIVTIAPFFVSTNKRLYIFGGLMFIACTVAIIFFTLYVTSVWCFFAAALSILILWILIKTNKN